MLIFFMYFMLQITINASVRPVFYTPLVPSPPTTLVWQPFMALHDLAGGITFSNWLSLLLL
jgi:hypothetical protein